MRFSDGTQLSDDRLVLASGAITEDFGVPDVAEHASTLTSLADATTMRNEVFGRFEEASANPDRATDDGLTFVISGGGPTGVERGGGAWAA